MISCSSSGDAIDKIPPKRYILQMENLETTVNISIPPESSSPSATVSPGDGELLEIGRIVTRTGEIEHRLAELGGSGSGLREKSESVSGLTPDVRRKLAFIGSIRNQVAHEGGMTISPEEITRFHAAAAEVLAALAALPASSESVSSGSTTTTTEDEPPPVRRSRKKTEPDKRTLPEAEEKSLPFALVPMAHLVFGLQRLFDGVIPAVVPLLLLLLESVSLILIPVGVKLHSPAAVCCGGALLAGCVGAGALDAFRRPLEARPPGWLVWIPGLNWFYFCGRMFQSFAYLSLFEGIVILGAWGAALLLAARGEWLAAAGVGAASYGVSVLVWFHSQYNGAGVA